MFFSILLGCLLPLYLFHAITGKALVGKADGGSSIPRLSTFLIFITLLISFIISLLVNVNGHFTLAEIVILAVGGVPMFVGISYAVKSKKLSKNILFFAISLGILGCVVGLIIGINS